MADLKPCPFCGGEAVATGVVRYHDKHEAWFSDGTRALVAHFCNCIACGITNRGLIGHQTQEKAIAAWNQRAPSSPSIEREVSMAFCPACFVEVTPEQADAQTNAARVLSEFAKTAPGRLPQRVQDAIAVVEGGRREVSGEASADGVPVVQAPAKVFTDGEIHAFYEAWEFEEADPGRLEFHSLVREIEHRVLERTRGVKGLDDAQQ